MIDFLVAEMKKKVCGTSIGTFLSQNVRISITITGTWNQHSNAWNPRCHVEITRIRLRTSTLSATSSG